MSPPEPTIKILLIGPSNSGKTALLSRYIDDIFDTDSATATIGVDFRIKPLSITGKPHRLLLFDTAGQERFRTLTSSYYRNAQGAILVYDVSNRESFLSMPHWFEEVRQHAGQEVVLWLVGSKVDKADAGAVKEDEGRRLAEKYGAGFTEVSAKAGRNVEVPFEETMKMIVESPGLLEGRRRRAENEVDVGRRQEDGGLMGGCAC